MQLIQILLALFLATCVSASKKTNREVKAAFENNQAVSNAFENFGNDAKQGLTTAGEAIVVGLTVAGKCVSPNGCQQAPGASIARWGPYLVSSAWMLTFTATTIPMNTAVLIGTSAAGSGAGVGVFGTTNLIYCDAGLACRATPPNMCGLASAFPATANQKRNC